jgi:hypothetical protein
MSLTSVSELDYEVLLKLDYKSILSMILTNSLYYSICSSEYFWKQKLERDYPDLTSYISSNYKSTYRVLDKLKLDDRWVIHKAIGSGNLYILVWLSQNGIFPNIQDIIISVRYGNLDILRWFTNLGIPLNQNLANIAAEYGYIHILEWLKERNILPTTEGANLAIGTGKLNVLIWLKQNNILPNIDGVEIAIRECRLNIIEWLKDQLLL